MTGPRDYGGPNPLGGDDPGSGQGDRRPPPPDVDPRTYGPPPSQGWQPPGVQGAGPQQFGGAPAHFGPPQYQGPPPSFQGPPPSFQGPPPSFQGPPPQYQGPQTAYPGPPLGYPGLQDGPSQPAPGWFQPAPPRRNRRRLLLGIGAALVVVAVVVTGVLVFGGSDDGEGSNATTASAAVQGYFDALSRGDAKAALSYGAQTPPDATFLTDEILKKQIEKLPIKNVKVLGEKKVKDVVSVHVVADVGDAKSDNQIQLTPPSDGGPWKIDRAFVVTDFDKDSGTTAPELFDVMTLFGKPLPKSGNAYLFPGYVEMGSSNPNLVVGISAISVSDFIGDVGSGTALVFPVADISKSGYKAIQDQLKDLLKTCAASHDFDPKGCPFGLPPDADTVPGSMRYTLTQSVDDLDLGGSFSSNDATMRISPPSIPVEYGWTSARTGEKLSFESSAYVSGDADMLQNPPKLKLQNLN